MLVDSHCHLNTLDLTEFNNSLDEVMALAKANDVGQMLSVCVELEDYPQLEQIASRYEQVKISVGIHPTTEMPEVITAEQLIELAKNPSCIAIGETGLDYYRTTEYEAQEAQRAKFKAHIQASKITKKPLIIHTRQAAEDTLRLLEEENASEIGGVMHCFSENWEVAERAMAMNFYISLSGILTFKNASALREVALKLPMDRVLIETDAPYLAPVPYRGKQNHPALVKYVAETLAELRGISYDEVARATTRNFQECFRINQ